MDLRQLRFFAEIARFSNFTRAAEELHVAQPAVSTAIRKLEEELELVLFNRQDRKVSLTAEGEILLEHARRILGDLKAAGQEMADLRGLGKGEVRVGVPPMMSAYFFPTIICAFAKRYPHLHLAVSGEGAASILKMIIQGELDMGVIAGGHAPDSLEVRHILREEVVMCIPPDHPFTARSAVSLEEFARQPLIMFKEGYYQREMLFEEMKESGMTPEVVFETNLYTMVKSLVKKGLGISTLLRMVVEDDAELRAVSFDPPLYLDLMLAWKKGAYLSRANRAFVDFLMEQVRGYGAASEGGGRTTTD
ncbi:LysR family transcriptional regulator [Geobacter sp. FeAm09]|uniref:LysR family transcriptional regulator n=1 Tax=Geobacter sp. FeAm09 TaxID=2597769 RepID=UPI0011EF8694|nr:LysR family transcriptional regulator [Geobacter sp. FeAm09]QEM69390.1 LysR family transcriptional regulator [Geobacter sp. FeAm09]